MAPSTFPLVSSDLHEGDPFQPHPARQHPVRSSSQTSQSPFADNTDSSERTRLNAQYSQGSPYISPQSSSGSFTPPPRSSSTVPSSRSTSPRRARAHQLASASSSNEFGDSRENFSPPTTVVGAGRAGWIPTSQHLYSTVSINNGDDTSRVLGSSPSTSSSRSRSRYDLAALAPDLLTEYKRTRYDRESDEKLHTLGPALTKRGTSRYLIEGSGRSGTIMTCRGLLNLGALVILCAALIMLFGGYPIVSYFSTQGLPTFGAAGPGGINGTGQVPMIAGYRGLIDKDTPDNRMTRTGYDGKEYQLVFSDEFEEDGRTFHEGEDPYWRAEDLHYWHRKHRMDGYMEISLTKEALADSHDRGYLGGLVTTWNKFCFQGGYIEVAISLPGDTVVQGLWPAAWTMSNLGRAGYGGSLDGTWPYVYEECDVGTLSNQTDPATGLPSLPKSVGDPSRGGSLSYLEGQRLSACTCPGELHPGPIKADGSFAGRGAAEIDIFEATIENAGGGSISQSGQWAPFNPSYSYINDSTEYVRFFESEFDTIPNVYQGGGYQQVTSGLSHTDPTTYDSTTNFMRYGFEYTPSFFNGYGTGEITFTQDDKPMWRLSDKAMGPNARAGVSERVVSGEPMYIILNLGMSESFGAVELDKLVFPAKMRIDHVRVYQPNDQIRTGCDPADHPTADYISKIPDAYNDPNKTVVADLGLTYPKNRLLVDC